MTNTNDTVLYIGVTSNLPSRTVAHKTKLTEGFTKRYNLVKLVYYETTPDIQSAIQREKHLKGWIRSRKISLIESVNPAWKDLSDEFL